MAIVEPPELPNFRLLDLIGCGGMGSVYIAYQKSTGKLVAIKFLDPKAAETPALLKQFKQEGELLKKLDHPNIVKFVDQGVADGLNYLIMEYIKGLSLDGLPLSHYHSSTDCAKQNLPTMEEYINIFIGCFKALSYIHKKGLVHRDIKPQNIILQGPTYEPCLIDFGIATFTNKDDDLNINPDHMFTVSYASPEQLTNKPTDALSDLFSFGVVMYEKLTGHLPFKGKRAMEVFIEQTKWKFSPPRQYNSNIPQKLEQIILKLISKDPNLRYPTADMVLGDLERLLEVTRLGQTGLSLTNIISEIKGVNLERKGFKKLTLREEQKMLKKQRAEVIDVKQRLRKEMHRIDPDQTAIENLQELCDTLQSGYARLEKQIQMVAGFKSQPIVIDKFNTIFKLETVAFEKRGIPFAINSFIQKLTTTDGEDIVVGSVNFTEIAKRTFSVNKKDSYLSWDNSNWYFSSYEEKGFPIYIMIGDKSMPRAPKGFNGFFWPFEFLVAIKKLGWTGVSIIETFKGIDRNGKAIFAEHKETILFSQSLFDKIG